MGYKIFDFCCECGWEGEDLVEADVKVIPCPNCGIGYAEKVLSVPNLATFSMADATTRANILKKRSAEHTQRELRKEPERFGSEGIARARKGQIRSK